MPDRKRLLNLHKAGIPAGAASICRGTPWGNPYRLGRDGDRGEILFKYRRWLERQPESYFASIRHHLTGRVLVCVCAPLACHGEFLLAIVDGRPWPSLGVNQLSLFKDV